MVATAKRHEKPTYNYQTMAHLVATKLSRDELIQLAELLDGDAGNDFCFFIQEQTAKVAPELYVNPESSKMKVALAEHGWAPSVNETVTIVGKDHECRWQVGSIKKVFLRSVRVELQSGHVTTCPINDVAPGIIEEDR